MLEHQSSKEPVKIRVEPSLRARFRRQLNFQDFENYMQTRADMANQTQAWVELDPSKTDLPLHNTYRTEFVK